jgi:hypothetical protein
MIDDVGEQFEPLAPEMVDRRVDLAGISTRLEQKLSPPSIFSF